MPFSKPTPTSLLPTQIFLLSSGASLAEPRLAISKIDVSVPAVRYRAFVFAAPQYFVAGNRSTEFRGAVSVGALSSACGGVG